MDEIDLKSLDLEQEACDYFEVRSVTTVLTLPEVISAIFNYRPGGGPGPLLGFQSTG